MKRTVWNFNLLSARARSSPEIALNITLQSTFHLQRFYINSRVSIRWVETWLKTFTDSLGFIYKIAIFRKETNSALVVLHAAPLSWSIWNFEHVGFCEGRKTIEPGEKWNPRSKARTSNRLNPHTAPDWNRTQATSVGGERSHQCTIRAHRAICSLWSPRSLQEKSSYSFDYILSVTK